MLCAVKLREPRCLVPVPMAGPADPSSKALCMCWSMEGTRQEHGKVCSVKYVQMQAHLSLM